MTLEVLMKTEKSLLDESIPFNFDSFEDCTCGHILRAVEGKRGYAGVFRMADHPEYVKVIQEVAVALGDQGELVYGMDAAAEAIYAVSHHTATASKVGSISRQDALKTVRTAMLALRPAEQKEYATT